MGRYRFMNGDGENTCAVCHGNDGQTYTLNELMTLGLIPPLHKNCRCKIVAEDSTKQPTSREKSYKNRLEKQIRIQEDIAAGDIDNSTEEECNYTAVKEDNPSERIKLPSPFMADAFGSKILNEPLPFDLFRGNMSAIEKVEYYIKQGQNTANNWLKAGWITLLLMNTPAKTIELIGKPFEQQYNYATGFSDPETAEIFGKVMSGYLIGSAIKDASKGLDMLEGKGSLKIVDGGKYSQSEIRAAEYMRDLGNDVTLRPPTGTRVGGLTSDLVVNGVNYDVYTPITSKASSIVSAVASKNSQTTGVIIDLSQTTVTTGELSNILARVEGSIRAGGGICNIKDIIILP